MPNSSSTCSSTRCAPVTSRSSRAQERLVHRLQADGVRARRDRCSWPTSRSTRHPRRRHCDRRAHRRRRPGRLRHGGRRGDPGSRLRSFTIRKEAKDHGVTGRLAGALRAGRPGRHHRGHGHPGHVARSRRSRVVRELGAEPVHDPGASSTGAAPAGDGGRGRGHRLPRPRDRPRPRLRLRGPA